MMQKTARAAVEAGRAEMQSERQAAEEKIGALEQKHQAELSELLLTWREISPALALRVAECEGGQRDAPSAPRAWDGRVVLEREKLREGTGV